MKTKDTAAFREIFEPDAKLVGMRPRQNGEAVVQVLPWDRFGAFMASDTRAPWIERAWSPEVRIRGTLATVWADDFHFGQTPSHCGVDAVQLLETPAGWKIVSIADTYEPTDCPKRESRLVAGGAIPGEARSACVRGSSMSASVRATACRASR